MPKITQLVGGEARNQTQTVKLIITTLLFKTVCVKCHERCISCYRKSEKNLLLSQSKGVSERCHFSWAYKDGYSLYIKAFEANPLNLHSGVFTLQTSPFFLFFLKHVIVFKSTQSLQKNKTKQSFDHTAPPHFIISLY